MMPAHESFKAHNLLSLQLDNGLVVKFELLLLDRCLQIALQAPPFPQLLILLRLKEGISTSTGRLRLIQGKIGILQKLIRVTPLAWRQDDADACRGAHFTPEHVMRLANGAQYTLGQLRGLHFSGDPRLNDGKFVAAEPRHHIGSAQDLAQALGHALEQCIARRMPQRVVHIFEVVEVDPMKGKAGAGLLKPTVERLTEVEAVGDFRQRVVPRQPGDLLFGLALFGDVLLQINPAAFRHRLISDEDNPAVFEMSGVGEGPATRQFGHMVLNPFALLFDILWTIRAGLPLDMIAHDLCKWRAPPRQPFGQIENLPIHPVADDQPLFRVEHRKPARHVV